MEDLIFYLNILKKGIDSSWSGCFIEELYYSLVFLLEGEDTGSTFYTAF